MDSFIDSYFYYGSTIAFSQLAFIYSIDVYLDYAVAIARTQRNSAKLFLFPRIYDTDTTFFKIRRQRSLLNNLFFFMIVHHQLLLHLLLYFGY